MDFWKLQGAGNDFIIFDNRDEAVDDLSDLATAACDRHFGVGADGLMAVGRSDAATVRMDFFNADGTRAAMCGNGIRCFAKYVQDSGIVSESAFTIETGDGIKSISILSQRESASIVSVDMGEIGELKDMSLYPFGVDAKTVFLHCGVPHMILFLEQDPSRPEIDRLYDKAMRDLQQNSNPEENAFSDAWIKLTERYGPLIEKSHLFLHGTNVNFAFVSGQDRMLVSTWERGAGRTLACGTGACASAAAACKLGLTGSRVYVRMPGGEVTVTIADNAVNLRGEAQLICKGSFFR